MTYLAGLRVLWRQNRKKTEPDEGWRPGTLRGHAFVDGLVGFFLATGDEVFREAVSALFKYGIIDDNGNFTRWEAPVTAKIKRHRELERVLCIRREIEDGRTLHRACAETAARTGHQASSFDAAIKDLKKKYKREAELGLPTDDAFRIDRDAINLELDNWRQKVMRHITKRDKATGQFIPVKIA